MTDAQMSDSFYSMIIEDLIRASDEMGSDKIEIHVELIRIIMKTLHARGRILGPIAELENFIPGGAEDDYLVQVSIAAGDIREAVEYRRMSGVDFVWDRASDR